MDGPTISAPTVATGIHAVTTGGDGSLTIDDCATFDYGIKITDDTHQGETTATIKDRVRQEVTLEPVDDDDWAWKMFIDGFFASTEDPEAPLRAGVTAASDDQFDQQIAALYEETDRLEELLDHPPPPLLWRDDFVAWRERTRTS